MAATAALIAAIAAPAQATADVLEVTSKEAAGDGSFAKAIRQANGDPDQDRIVFARGLRGAIEIDGDLTLRAPAKITGRGEDRIALRGPASGATLRLAQIGRTTVIRDLTLRRVGIFANAKMSDGKLKLRRTTLSGDGIDQPGVRLAAEDKGYSPELNAAQVTIRNFHTGVETGYGSATIDRSSIFGNGPGHGVDIGYYGFAEITDTTISGNVASEQTSELDAAAGGGIYSTYGTTVVTNSTISGNSAVGPDSTGGGVYGSNVYIRSSTVTGNSAEHGGGLGYPFGPIRVEDSIVAGNEAATPQESDCFGGVQSRGGNVFGFSGLCDPAPSDIGGIDPELGPLADNGGPTPTHSIGAGSPAIGQARGDTPKRDQRGVRRDADPDAGAFER